VSVAVPTSAMVFAAGLGTRMRPLTNDRPKALVEVDGRALVDHMLDALAQEGVTRAVVNAFHFADRLVEHLEARAGRPPQIILSREDGLQEPLETEGGLVNALDLVCGGRDETIFTCNADAIWTDTDALTRLAASFDPERMDGLLLLAPLERSLGFDGKGDFFLHEDGQISRRGEAAAAPFAYAGVQITRSGHFLGRTPTKRSLNKTWFEQWSPRGRLFGLPLTGDWLHVGDPAARDAAEAHLRAGKQER
jgi:N-acetyl-alpha-D-muramate 1-phosphate uridylyltransferase